MPRKGGHQPALLKRKRTISEDEDDERPSKRCTNDESEVQYVNIDSDILRELELEVENNPPQESVEEEEITKEQEEIDETCLVANETVEDTELGSDNIAPSSDLGSDGDVILATPIHPTWSQFRGLPYILTPATDRLSPLPVLTWANPREVWELMCHKDEVSSHERDEDLFVKHAGLQPRMRAILLDWLIEVCEVYKIHRETYHLTMDFIDRYLSHRRGVPKQHLQLIGITCLFIASKVEEIYPPKITEYAFVTDGACSETEILDMELVILKTLNWNLTPMTVNSWLNMYMQLTCDSRKKARLNEQLGRPDPTFVLPQYSGLSFIQTAQLVDLCMLDEGSLKFPYSVLAATALYHTFSRELALFVSGLQWGDIAKCVKWMTPFASVVREEGQELIAAASMRQSSNPSDNSNTGGLLKVAPNLVGDDSHNLQTHIVDLHMLDRAKARLNEMTTSLEVSPDPKSSNLLTPPSSGNRLSDRHVTLTGSLT